MKLKKLNLTNSIKIKCCFSVSVKFCLIFLFAFDCYSVQEDRPNIIIYLSDDLSYLDVSVYGAEVVKTPTLQQLSEEGMVFMNAFIASPSCAPSRAALLTGLMPARNGAEVNHSFPKEGVASLIGNLKENDYKVYAFGKVAHGKGNQHFGFDYHNDSQVDLLNNLKGFFDSTQIDSPICLFVGDRRPHVLWTTEKAYGIEQVDFPEYFIDTKETREHRARYYTDITDMDTEIGQILKYLEPIFGINTLTLFSSDHGAQWPFAKWNLYDAGIRTPLIVKWPGKIDPGKRTNAMVSWIDILPTILDITGATIPVGLDGQSFSEILYGKKDNFRDYIFTTHSGDGILNIYPIRSVRNERYKLIVNLIPEAYHSNHSDIFRYDGAGGYWDSWNQAAKTDQVAANIIERYYERPALEFYDIQNDPTEQKNLAETPEFQKEIAVLRKVLDEWLISQGDELQAHNEPYLKPNGIPTEKMIQNRKNK